MAALSIFLVVLVMACAIVVNAYDYDYDYECKDKTNICDKYKDRCEDSWWMKDHCAMTCGFCTKECKDKTNICDKYKDRCEDSWWMKDHCAMTCGFCTKEAPDDPDIISVDDFISTFNKSYDTEEDKNKRIAIFKDNVRVMKDHNKLYESGVSSYKMGVSEYSDMTYEEVIQELTGINASDIARKHKRSGDWYVPTQLGEEPSSLDYRDEGAVNPIRHQGGCGSCWAFSVTSSIESNIFIKEGTLLQLSEQNLVDCSTPNGNYGCRGGWLDTSFEYVIDEGIAYKDEYPYTARDDTCNEAVKKFKNVVEYKKVRGGCEDEQLNALVHIGPLSILMYVSSNFVKYKKGILFDPYCTSDAGVNHGMTLIGYGTENGQDYWLIRNSWGSSWGENGYVKLARNRANHCWIASYGVVPIIQECKDKTSNCDEYKDRCEDPRLMKDPCAMTCGYCTKGK